MTHVDLPAPRFPGWVVLMMCFAALGSLNNGCSEPGLSGNGKRELALSWSKKQAKANFATGRLEDTATPANLIRVRAAVIEVALPPLNSPSIGGERAVAVFSVKAGGVPTYPDCIQLKLRYDAYANPFSVGQTVTFLFLPDGRFWTIEAVRF